MKKTLITLLALSGIAMGDVTKHDVDFTTVPNGGGSQGWANRGTTNYDFNRDVWSNGTALDYGGMYISSTGGLKVNSKDVPLTTNYLYLSDNIKFQASTGTNAGELNVSGGSLTIAINDVSGEGAVQEWVDINADYGTRIIVSNMDGGSIYLNTAGALTLGKDDLKDTVTVFATVTDTANVRTLLSGTDLTGWTGTVVLQNADGTAYTGTDYIYETSATGLSIIAAPVEPTPTPGVPEPTTATLSLLALAGLAARRRRK